MTDIVANGTEGDDNIQSSFWRREDFVSSNMGAGHDYFAGWGASYNVNGEDGNDTITGGYMGGVATGGAGDDSFSARGRDVDDPTPPATHTMSGGDGNDDFLAWGSDDQGTMRMNGDAGVDRFTDSRYGGVDNFNGGAGFDWVEISGGGAVAVTLGTVGLAGNALGSTYKNIEGIQATNLADTVTGNGLHNVIAGGQGADTLAGGAGNDLLLGRNFGQYFFQAFTATRNQTSATNAFSYTESSALHRDQGYDDDGAADRLDGGDGNDVLYGGWGADTLDGGAGRDLASFRDSNEAVQVNLATGTGVGGTAAGDTYLNIEDLHGSEFSDILTGKAGVNKLTGRDGNDTLDGGAGADTMTGGWGDDTFYISESGDRTIEAEGQGTDTVYSPISRTLHANLENLILQGSANTAGRGNELANQITGNSGNNTLEGFDANDTLTGNAGADTLRGGAGSDSMAGGAGNDTYFVDDGGDQTIEDTAGQAGGIDTVFSTIDRTLGPNLEHLRLQGTGNLSGTGNELNNKISGTIGANHLRGLSGNDTLEGNDGADTLVGGEGNDTMTGGSQADVFRFTTSLSGADVITDFNKNADRFDLGGGTFTQLTITGADTILRHDGGTIRIHGVTTLTLAQWKALILPSGADAVQSLSSDAFDHFADVASLLARMQMVQIGHGEWIYA